MPKHRSPHLLQPPATTNIFTESSEEFNVSLKESLEHAPTRQPRDGAHEPRLIAKPWMAIGYGKSTFYEELKRGRLRVVKVGRRIFMTRADLDEYISSLTPPPSLAANTPETGANPVAPCAPGHPAPTEPMQVRSGPRSK